MWSAPPIASAACLWAWLCTRTNAALRSTIALTTASNSEGFNPENSVTLLQASVSIFRVATPLILLPNACMAAKCRESAQAQTTAVFKARLVCTLM